MADYVTLKTLLYNDSYSQLNSETYFRFGSHAYTVSNQTWKSWKHAFVFAYEKHPRILPEHLWFETK